MSRFDYIFDKFMRINNISFYVGYAFISVLLTLYLSPLYFEKTFSVIFVNWFGLILLTIILIQFLVFNVKFINYKKDLRRDERAVLRNSMFYLNHSYHSARLNTIVRPSGHVEMLGSLPRTAGVEYNRIQEMHRRIREDIVERTRHRNDSLIASREHFLRRRQADTERNAHRYSEIRRRQIERMNALQEVYRVRNQCFDFNINTYTDPNDPIINSIDDLYDE